ncbi:hypothetical protein IJH23_02995 [Candidatus Saccharibacteria bacterium]|nr:hypothetical protein [Candidatus Saccharibacteria bacterium]
MKTFKDDLLKIYQSERGIIIFAILNLLLAIALFVVSVLNLNPNAAVVKIGYGDVGGYRDGTWTSLLVFPLLAVLFGLFHPLLSVRIFHKRGGGMAKFFLVVTAMLILGTFFVLIRLMREG